MLSLTRHGADMPAPSLAHQVLARTDDFPIRAQAIHQGKVRALYRLTEEDSARLIQERGYDVPLHQPLGVMITSDRISAFDCNWQGEMGLMGVPQKGAALNAIAYAFFHRLQSAGIAGHHILEAPHPLVWIVRIAEPLRFEGILRRYITGSLWRAYSQGTRDIYGFQLPDGLEQNQKLPSLLFTPSTKGTLFGLADIPETEDAPIRPTDIQRHYQAFGLPSPDVLPQVQALLEKTFLSLEDAYKDVRQILIDTKFELGYVPSKAGSPELILMDEVGTPDASRLWDQASYERGNLFEYCKEHFRQTLLEHLDRTLLLDPERLPERKRYAAEHPLPVAWFMDVSQRYTEIAEKLIGTPLPTIQDARNEIIVCLEKMDILQAQRTG